jgi:hypothetical protein
MITFLKKRSYDIVVMYITQIAISIFGLALAFAVPTGQPQLNVIASVVAIIFYLFLTYTKLWELGYKDSNAFAKGTAKLSRIEGLYMGLCASVLNFLLAIFIIIGGISENGVIDAIAGGAATASLLTEGMYTGLLSVKVGGVALNSVGIMYLVITLPMIIAATLGYLAGIYDFKIFGGSKKTK